MATIKTNLNVTLTDGPKVAIPSISMEVEAYDKIEISLDSGGEANIDVQPGAKAVSFLLITSSLYTPSDAPAAEQLTFSTGDKADINLSSPQLYMGTDTISKLLNDVKQITVKNQLAKTEKVPSKDDSEVLEDVSIPSTADISILVGRDATPPPAT